jgi:hypothetical protein
MLTALSSNAHFLEQKNNGLNKLSCWSLLVTFKITDSFEEFIYRLYYEKPDFYDDIIIEHYRNLGYAIPWCGYRLTPVS